MVDRVCGSLGGSLIPRPPPHDTTSADSGSKLISTAQTRLQMTSLLTMAVEMFSLFYSGRKRRCVRPSFLQSMSATCSWINILVDREQHSNQPIRIERTFQEISVLGLRSGFGTSTPLLISYNFPQKNFRNQLWLGLGIGLSLYFTVR